MKILMVLDHEFPPDIRVENEISTLFNKGHEVHLACSTHKGRPEKEEFHHMTIHRKVMGVIRHKSSIACLKVPYYFNFWRSFVGDLMRRNSFDAIHIHDLPLATIGWEAKKSSGLHFVLDLHENWPALLETAVHTNTIPGKILSSNAQWRRYEMEMTGKADAVIAVAEEMRDRIAALGIDPSKIFVLPNTAPIDSLTLDPSLKPDPNFKTLVYAGGINRHRGLQFVIQGMKLIIDQLPELRLWIIGSGKYEASLRKMSTQLKLNRHIDFMGYKPFPEMFRLLQQSDIALIPHIKSEQNDNSSPNKIFQYMYASKPVISSNCTSLERLLRETDAGISYIYDDPSDFATKVSDLFSDPARLHKLGYNGKQSVIKKYNWNNCESSLINLYRGLEK
jgi:glycosyltransferase involved in cell wall biosynthesis